MGSTVVLAVSLRHDIFYVQYWRVGVRITLNEILPARMMTFFPREKRAS